MFGFWINTKSNDLYLCREQTPEVLGQWLVPDVLCQSKGSCCGLDVGNSFCFSNSYTHHHPSHLQFGTKCWYIIVFQLCHVLFPRPFIFIVLHGGRSLFDLLFAVLVYVMIILGASHVILFRFGGSGMSLWGIPGPPNLFYFCCSILCGAPHIPYISIYYTILSMYYSILIIVTLAT